MKYLIILALLVSGCATTQVPAGDHVVNQHKLVLITVPPSLLVTEAPLPPPDIKAYMQMSKDAREDALVRYMLKQSLAVKACYADKQAISDIIAKEEVIVKKFNDDEAIRVRDLQKTLKEKE